MSPRPRRVPAALALFALLSAGLAGCLTDGGGGADNSGFVAVADPIPVGEGHDHNDPAQHRFASRASILDVDDLQRFGADDVTAVGAHALARHGDMVAVAMRGMNGQGQQGFHLFDASDPANLEHLSFYDAGVPVSGDRTIAFSGDGNTVFLGFERGPRPGVVAVDVSDPRNPVEAAFFLDPVGVVNPTETGAPLGFGPHTVSAGTIDGVEYVFYVAYGVAILRYDGDFEVVGRFATADELMAADALRQLDPTNPQTGKLQTYALRSVYAHDAVFFEDDDGTPYLLVSYAYDGFKLLDISDPRLPVLVARWLPPRDTDHPHYVHSAAAARIEGRFIIVVGAETFEPENQGIASPLWVLDATDTVATPAGLALSPPVHLSTWRNPGDAPSGELHRSAHFFRIHEGVLYLSHYHGGVWAIDLRTEDARADPPVLSYILPVPDPAVLPPEDCCLGYDTSGTPMVLDVEVTERGVFAADYVQGLVALSMET